MENFQVKIQGYKARKQYNSCSGRCLECKRRERLDRDRDRKRGRARGGGRIGTGVLQFLTKDFRGDGKGCRPSVGEY